MARKLALKLALAIAPAILIVSACGGGEAPAPTTAPAKPANGAPVKAGDAAAGEAVFQQNCTSCHPDGNEGVGPMLRGRDDLTAERISTQVRNGGGQMPAFPENRISDQQLSDLVAYVMSLE